MPLDSPPLRPGFVPSEHLHPLFQDSKKEKEGTLWFSENDLGNSCPATPTLLPTSIPRRSKRLHCLRSEQRHVCSRTPRPAAPAGSGLRYSCDSSQGRIQHLRTANLSSIDASE